MAQQFDFVILGSGLGGLQCGYILADFGFSVCILEKNHQLGGCLQVFAREKTVFDTGVHYIGGLDHGQDLYRYFSYFGLMDGVKWKRLDSEGFDRITFSGDPQTYHHDQGWDAFVQRLTAHFPSEKDAIAQYRDTIEQVAANFPMDRLEYSDTDHLDPGLLYLSASEFINGLTGNERLRDVLAGSSLLHAATAERCPLFVHALTTNGYMHGAWRCVDGGSQIAKVLAKGVHGRGGIIHRRTEVTHLRTDGGRITSAVCADGREFSARNFISNIHPKNTFDLLPPGVRKGPYFKRITSLPNSLSSFSAHIVCRPGSFPFLNHNHYHHRSSNVFAQPDYKVEDWPLIMMLSTPASSRTGEFADGMTLLSYMRSSEVALWADTHNTIVQPGYRGEDYEEFKRDRTERLIAAAEEIFPDIRSCIQSVHCTTPLTFRDYIGTDDGSMYGLEKDFRSPLRTFIPPHTKVSNLYLTGQNINLHGMAGVTISSVLTCSSFVGRKELIGRIRSQSNETR
ncbi:MAG: NAD(P)/FAD-dependent oxidoreductase [Flavobacteriales bacterium]|nr:NAD(P)/FAD-dependent oxidoreductase [Flavobacteriales bacterium]